MGNVSVYIIYLDSILGQSDFNPQSVFGPLNQLSQLSVTTGKIPTRSLKIIQLNDQ